MKGRVWTLLAALPVVVGLSHPGPARADVGPALEVSGGTLASALHCPATFTGAHNPVLLVHGTTLTADFELVVELRQGHARDGLRRLHRRPRRPRPRRHPGLGRVRRLRDPHDGCAVAPQGRRRRLQPGSARATLGDQVLAGRRRRRRAPRRDGRRRPRFHRDRGHLLQRLHRPVLADEAGLEVPHRPQLRERDAGATSPTPPSTRAPTSSSGTPTAAATRGIRAPISRAPRTSPSRTSARVATSSTSRRSTTPSTTRW